MRQCRERLKESDLVRDSARSVTLIFPVRFLTLHRYIYPVVAEILPGDLLCGQCRQSVVELMELLRPTEEDSIVESGQQGEEKKKRRERKTVVATAAGVGLPRKGVAVAC
ncbi:unnamed protein product [Linum trigynum]|uniref:Uncharacterized protein n=1 Tax=Linum trigynum TaxID=586398 RepID=A0AAV2FW87_9ROSI